MVDNNEAKSWWASKTIDINAGLAALLILAQSIGVELDQETLILFVIVAFLGNILLRLITDKPIGK